MQLNTMIKNNIKGLIKDRSKTLIQVANETGLSFQQLSNIQNNKPSKISYKTLWVLIRYFNCSFNDIFVKTND